MVLQGTVSKCKFPGQFSWCFRRYQMQDADIEGKNSRNAQPCVSTLSVSGPNIESNAAVGRL